jgi:hypothetical protein
MTCGNSNLRNENDLFYVNKIFYKIHNGHKNEKLKQKFKEQYICIINIKNGVKLMISFNKAYDTMSI